MPHERFFLFQQFRKLYFIDKSGRQRCHYWTGFEASRHGIMGIFTALSTTQWSTQPLCWVSRFIYCYAVSWRRI